MIAGPDGAEAFQRRLKALVWRPVHPGPGMRGWIHSAHPYHTPPELPHGTEVTVLAGARGSQEVTVRDGAGKEWTLLHWQVEVGKEYTRNERRWLPESDPRVHEAILDYIALLENERWEERLEERRREGIEEWWTILARYGVPRQDVSQRTPFHAD